jgi:NAD(P)H-dependent FMN reductase
MNSAPKIGIILGSTRPGRNGAAVATWVHELAAKRGDADYELVDLLDYALPHLDEPMPPSVTVDYAKEHTAAWSAKIASLDGFVFVTPEYNHSTSGALKNAIDFVYREWNNKAAGFVSYGADSGLRAVEHLRTVLAELQVATVREQVKLDSYRDFENFYDFRPTERHEQSLNTLIDQLIAWGGALKPLRG